MGRLDGKVCLVTASTRGIGRAIADMFIDEGAIVWYAVRNLVTGQAAVDEANTRCGEDRARLVYFEANEMDTHTSMIEKCVAAEGRLDVLVNNFGSSDIKKDLDIMRMEYADFEHTINLDISTVFNASKAAINLAMKNQKSGSIINIGSVAAIDPDATQCGYGVAKAGINHLTKQVARQVAPYNIRCNVLNPGITATDAVRRSLTPETQVYYTANCWIKRVGEPTECATMATFLASDESQYITGHVMNVSGGWQ